MNKHLGVRGRVGINVLFEPRDMWFGIYRAKRYWEMGKLYLPLYICLIPMCVILLTIEVDPRRQGDEF